MTVSNQKRSIRYQGNDSATEFDYDFFIEEATHVEVIIYNSTNETYTTLTGGQYSITGLNDPGFGAVTYPLAGDPLSTDEYIIINRVAPYVQVMDILPQGGFHPDVIEAALDRTTRQIQQIAEIQSRSLFIVEGEGFQKRLPLRSLLVDRVLAFDENGDPTLGPTATNVDNAQGYADAAEAARDAAQTAQGAAETAQGAAETAQGNAETAQTAAEAAKDAAETAQGNAETSASTATTQAGIATTKAGEANTSAINAAASETAAEAAQTAAEAAQAAAEATLTPGGTTGQALVKSSGTDYDTEWGSVATAAQGAKADTAVQPAALAAVQVPTGGTTGQVLAKSSNTDNDVGWTSANAGDVLGPSSAADSELAAFDSTTGKLLKKSTVQLSEIARATPTPPTFAYRFKEGQPLPNVFSFTRDDATPCATRLARSALLETAAANVLRHHYAVDGAYRGVTVESQVTNLLTYSEQFDNGGWTKVRATVSANAAVAPDGTTTADKLVLDATAANTHYIRMGHSHTSGLTYCKSVYAKAAELSWIVVFVGSSGAAFSANPYVFFDLANGVVGSEVNGATGGIEDVGDGWYRCWVEETATSTATDYIFIELAEGDNDITIDGDGSSGVYLWGAQSEPYRESPSAYIKTEASTVTRAADELTADIEAVGFNANEGTFYWRGSTLSAPPDRNALLFARESSTRGIALHTFSDGTFRFMVRGASGLPLVSSTIAAVDGEEFSVAAYWNADELGISVNGEVAVTTANTAGAVAPTAFWIGRGTGASAGDANYQNGPVKEFAVWDRALSAAEIQTLSARGPAIGETLYAPEVMKRVGLPISGLLGSGDGVAANLQAVFDGAPDGSTFIFEDAVDWGSTRPSSPYITLPRKVRLEWKQPWDLTGFASTTSSPIILQRGGELTGSTIDLDGTPSLTAGETDRVTVASGQGGNFAVGERWLLHATASLTTLTGAFTLLDSAGSPYYNRRCESVWVERVEGDVVYFTKPISDDYPNSCDPRLIKYDDDIDIELINPMVDAFTPYADVDEGNWATSTAYSVGDHVIYDNRGYVCTSAHTSDSTNFSTDYAASRWLDMGSDRFLDVTLARRLRIIGGRARRLSGMFARISGVADLEIDGLRGDMNDKGSAAPGGFLFVGGDTDGARFRNLDVTGGGQPFMQSSTGGHYGVMRNSLWENCISRGSLNGAFSQHNIEERTTYRNCKAIDCDGPAFDVRTRGNRMHNCEAVRCGTVLYLRNVVDGFEIDGLTAESCISGLRLTTFSGAHEVTPGSIDIRNVSMRDIGGTGSVGALSMEYGYDVLLGRLAVENFNAAMNNATIAMTIGGRWNRPEFKNVSIHGTSGTGRPIYMHDASLGAAKGPYAPVVDGLNYGSTYAAPLVQNLGGVPTWKNQTVINGGANTITISSGGALTLLFGDEYIVSANSGTTDNLDTMPLMASGTTRRLRAASGHTITARNVDNIVLRGGAASVNFTSTALLTLVAIGSSWYEV